MDRKVTSWFIGLIGLIVVEGGFDFFSDKDPGGDSTWLSLVSFGVHY